MISSVSFTLIACVHVSLIDFQWKGGLRVLLYLHSYTLRCNLMPNVCSHTKFQRFSHKYQFLYFPMLCTISVCIIFKWWDFFLIYLVPFWFYKIYCLINISDLNIQFEFCKYGQKFCCDSYFGFLKHCLAVKWNEFCNKVLLIPKTRENLIRDHNSKDYCRK